LKGIGQVDERESDAIKLEIYRNMSIQMLNDELPYLTVRVYYPIEANDPSVESEIKILAEKWVKKFGFTVSNRR
jgi:GTPase Era involved in 16S rRNA processing